MTFAQLALLWTQIALTKYWESLGVKPDVVIGHSLGEYAALCAARVISASDAIFVAGTRAVLLQRKCTAGSHTMLAVKASVPEVCELAQGHEYEIAYLNGPQDTVLAGPRDAIEGLACALVSAGLKCVTLNVDFAFHSSQTEPILDEFEELVRAGVIFQAPEVPIIYPLFAKMVYDNSITANYLRKATRDPVNFVGALESALRTSSIHGSMAWVEIGPHPVCVNFVQATLASISAAVPSLRRGMDNYATLANSLASLHCAGLDINWDAFHKPFEKALLLLGDLPAYAWNNKTYWIQYNGDLASRKGNTFYDAKDAQIAPASSAMVAPTGPRTASVQAIVEESNQGSK